MPAPEALNDQEVTAKLWEVINKMAQMRIFLEDTDHLSDRELYTKLWGDLLREETKDILLDQDSACHYQLLSSGSDEDTYLYLKYFADEEWREWWHKDLPGRSHAGPRRPALRSRPPSAPSPLTDRLRTCRSARQGATSRGGLRGL